MECTINRSDFDEKIWELVEPAEEPPDPDLNNFNVQDIQDLVSTIDDGELLERLSEQEEEGRNRKGALEAIEARREELAG